MNVGFVKGISVFAVTTLLTIPAIASGDSLRFRFSPAGPDGMLQPIPVGPGGTLGELFSGVSSIPKAGPTPFRVKCMVTFRHPYTATNVNVPLRLLESTPVVEHRGDRVRLNYGSYFVDARFIPDGSVDVIYNSGFLRPLPF